MSRRKAGPLKAKTVITSIVICSAVSLVGIGYVWAKTEVWGLSRELKRLEVRREELKRINEGLERRYAAMCTHERLAMRVKDLQLGLLPPVANQVIRLPEGPVPAPQQTSNRFYAVTGRE